MFKHNKAVWGWALYDWGNSAFATTVMAGFFPIFFKQYWSSGADVNMSTAQLGLANSVASLLVALMAPVLGAIADRGSYKKRFMTLFAYLGVLMTACLFLVEQGNWLMAVLVFSVWLGWLPGFGYETVGAGYTGLARAFDIAKHLVLPALTLGLFFMAVYMRMTRASMLEVSQLDFVKTAKAKGLSGPAIRRRHILRNAILPVVTLAGLQAGQLVGGAVLTETVFAWPGIGRLMFESLAARDYNTILGVFLVSAAMVILFNIVTDIVYRLVDPRIGAKA